VVAQGLAAGKREDEAGLVLCLCSKEAAATFLIYCSGELFPQRIFVESYINFMGMHFGESQAKHSGNKHSEIKTKPLWKSKLGQGFLSFNVHTNNLGILLK